MPFIKLKWKGSVVSGQQSGGGVYGDSSLRHKCLCEPSPSTPFFTFYLLLFPYISFPLVILIKIPAPKTMQGSFFQ